MHGVSVEEFLSRATSMDADLEWVHPEDREHYRYTTRQLQKTKGIVELEYRIIPTGGGEIHVRERGVAVVNSAGVHLRSYGFIQDITNLKAAENALLDLHHRQEELLEQRTEELRRSEQRYAFAISGSEQGVWEWDIQTSGNYLSGQWKRILGYADNELPNEPGTFVRIIHPDDLQNVETAVRAHLKNRERYDIDHRVLRKDGTPIWVRARGHAIWDAENHPLKMGGTISDITEYRRLLENARYYAERDQLTGLYNRHYFTRSADQFLKDRGPDCVFCGVAILDLDEFKEINDCHGHPAGDSTLVTIAERLVREVGNRGIVIRLGGDEFAIVFCLKVERQSPETFFHQLLEALSKPISWHGFVFECTASAGLAIKNPNKPSNATELLQHADLAVYDAKASGGNCVRSFTEDLLTSALDRTKTLSTARSALAEDRFVVCYQPKIDLKTLKLAGFEALLRRTNDDGSLVSPADYIEVFEDSVLSCRIGNMVRRQLFEQAAVWKNDGFDFGHIAFNISPPEFQANQRDFRFVDDLVRSITDTGLEPENIHVEVTEDVLFTEKRQSVAGFLGRLRESGIKVALDDFGTGHASLIHLKEAEFDLIKLDISFVRSMLTSQADMAIVETVCSLADKLEKQIVAEGIETKQQLMALQKLGVSFGQGYLIGHPLPAEAAQEVAQNLSI
ncbi:putative bifunctional diguanylate cyclase/phosphodiesterase [Roseibium sp.]|uniref:putative bifunctional diguanylate cyclase/phosphodiesterase n=1 Tax=Roseibium sp. TaxID=1936156 RepID=UPI003B51A0A7